MIWLMSQVSIPNSLTLLRIIVSLILALLLKYKKVSVHWVLLLAFLGGITDFLDGFFARILNQETLLGQTLDPIADKLLSVVSLIWIMKLYPEPEYYWLCSILLLRDFFISGLREALALLSQTPVLPPSFLGKLKTALQQISTLLLLLNENHFIAFPVRLSRVGYYSLLAATLCSVVSMVQYTCNALASF